MEFAENRPESAWLQLARPLTYSRAGPRRRRPPKFERQIIRRPEFLHLELCS